MLAVLVSIAAIRPLVFACRIYNSILTISSKETATGRAAYMVVSKEKALSWLLPQPGLTLALAYYQNHIVIDLLPSRLLSTAVLCCSIRMAQRGQPLLDALRTVCYFAGMRCSALSRPQPRLLLTRQGAKRRRLNLTASYKLRRRIQRNRRA